MGLMTIRVKAQKYPWSLLTEKNNPVFDDIALSWLESTCPACACLPACLPVPGGGYCNNNTSQPNWRLWLANWAELGNKTRHPLNLFLWSTGPSDSSADIGLSCFGTFRLNQNQTKKGIFIKYFTYLCPWRFCLFWHYHCCLLNLLHHYLQSHCRRSILCIFGCIKKNYVFTISNDRIPLNI